MKAHIQFGLLKLANPRLVRALLIGLTLALALLGHSSVIYGCYTPGGASAGCGGG
ncbi:MAG: hypothetical protein WBW48_14085 [Anaerolineae bacterium]